MTIKRNICLACGGHFYCDLGGEADCNCESSEIMPPEKTGKDGEPEKNEDNI